MLKLPWADEYILLKEACLIGCLDGAYKCLGCQVLGFVKPDLERIGLTAIPRGREDSNVENSDWLDSDHEDFVLMLHNGRGQEWLRERRT